MALSATHLLLPESDRAFFLDKNFSIVASIAKGGADRFGLTGCAARDGNAWVLYDLDDGTSLLRKVKPSDGSELAKIPVATLLGTRVGGGAPPAGAKSLVAGLCGWLLTSERETGQLVAVKAETVTDNLTPDPDGTPPVDPLIGTIVRRYNLTIAALDCAINAAATRLLYCDGTKVNLWDIAITDPKTGAPREDRFLRTVVDVGVNVYWPVWLPDGTFQVSLGGFLRDGPVHVYDMSGALVDVLVYPGSDGLGGVPSPFNEGQQGLAAASDTESCLSRKPRGLALLAGDDPDKGDGYPNILPIRIETGEVLPAVVLKGTGIPQTDVDLSAAFTLIGAGAFPNVLDTEDEPPDQGGGERGPCPPPGPGGSSFDGSPEGDRRVQPGGYPASYSAPTGGGVTPTADDPDDPQPLETLQTPLVSLDLTVCDGTVYRLAKSTFPRPGAAQMDPRVIRWGAINYPLSDRFGSMAGQGFEVEIADTDGFFRGLVASGPNRFFKRWLGDLYVEDDGARLRNVPRQRLGRGRCITVRTGQTDQSLVLVFSDDYSRHDSPYSLDRELPHVLIGDIFGDGASSPDLVTVPRATEEIAARAATFLLAEASDEYRAAENPPVTPISICQLHDLGDVELDGETWRAYFASLYASHSVPALFGSNLDPDCPASVRLNPALYNGDGDTMFLVPGYAPWDAYFPHKYIAVTVGDKTYWVTVIFGRGPISDAHVDQKVPLTANINGIEDVGDGYGNLIDDAARQAQWLLDHPVLRRTTSGLWGDVARFPDGVAKIRTSSVEAVRTIHNARLSTRYRGAAILDQRRAARDWLADLCVSWDIRYGLNHHGQIVFTTLDTRAALTGLRTFTDLLHIIEDSFNIASEINAELENSLEWEAGPEPASGRLTVPKSTLPARDSIRDWGDTYTAQPITFAGWHRPDAAGNVAAHRLMWTQDGITRGSFDIDLAGGSLRQGELVRLTHLAGIGPYGWRRRLLLVADRTLLIDDADWKTRVQWEDADPVFFKPGTDEPRIGFRPIGSSALHTGWIVGSTADGTAYRVA